MSDSPRASEAAGGLVPHAALPHHLLSALMLELTRVRWPPWKNWQIRWFIRRYGVDMSQAVEPRGEVYPHFNAFFTRELTAEARPLAEEPDALLAPADGVLSQFGAVEGGSLVQAKGRRYQIDALLGGDADLAAEFAGGSFATVYLSPRDYHRVHMPLDGRLQRMIYVPGRLFSVNDATVARVPNLFCRNERVISVFETAYGRLAVILVGALFVGCMEQTWCGVVTPPRGHRVVATDYTGEQQVRIARGAEMGRFNMGSTVVLLTQAPCSRWTAAPGDSVRVRAAIGSMTSAG